MKTIIAAALAVYSITAFAQENELRLGTDSAQSRKGADADNIISNKQLRASSGSTSLWSVGTAFNYNGGSIRKPLAEDRPNIAGTTATTDKALLDGQMNVKYNFSAAHSLNAGMGLRWIAPLKSGTPDNYEGQRFDLANPFLTYQYLYNLGGMESVLQVQPMAYTESNLRQLGYSWSVLVNQDSVREIAHSGLSLGFSIWAQYGVYSKNDPEVLGEQADYLFGLSPLMEYEFNDTFNLRTVLNLWNFEHLRSYNSPHTYVNDRVTQSLGVGISVARDFFLYPNVQFVPEDLQAELTNVGVSAEINIF